MIQVTNIFSRSSGKGRYYFMTLKHQLQNKS